ncbi:cytochrome b/b6 domain-containing protein [Chromohalobacter canadensis]|uniref:cytochrome b/b6 domain-containing protein n=1 Tax=Chromohalobacter canadensis TaxID=141389 RepID=UPI002481C8BA|nr:cytochrome b/b6 domain-containing protein [Chromohalobacter canadensis]
MLQHLRNMRHGHERHYDGHNPAGSAMVFLLLGGLGLQAILGWLLTTHTFHENALIETVHPILGNALLIAAILHVIGVIISSKLTKQNLAKAMITGQKTKKTPRIDSRAALTAALSIHALPPTFARTYLTTL